jgi:hypothetical protein
VISVAPPLPYETTPDATSFIKDGVLHHAAVFSVVRWTNIRDPLDEGTVGMGDFISAPAKGNKYFGQAIKDEKVKLMKRDGKRGFTHNDYWLDLPDASDAPRHLDVLREAVGFARKPPFRAGPSGSGIGHPHLAMLAR